MRIATYAQARSYHFRRLCAEQQRYLKTLGDYRAVFREANATVAILWRYAHNRYDHKTKQWVQS
jgi:hypothetical protein